VIASPNADIEEDVLVSAPAAFFRFFATATGPCGMAPVRAVRCIIRPVDFTGASSGNQLIG
jgi:hypothetical protein